MGYFNFKNNITPVNDTNLNAMQKGLMEMAFPIGSTYITQANTNPSEILEFGTWERLKGRVCVGLDEDDEDGYFDEIGKEGGEKKHTQTLEELVVHTHEYGVSDTEGGQTQNQPGYGGNEKFKQATSKVGGGKPMNITQPYRVVGYMWIRTA